MRTPIVARAGLALLLVAGPSLAQDKKGIHTEAAPEERPGTPAPALVLSAVGGDEFDLAAEVAEAHVLLVFVRGMW